MSDSTATSQASENIFHRVDEEESRVRTYSGELVYEGTRNNN
jgi:hypothetical protein